MTDSVAPAASAEKDAEAPDVSVVIPTRNRASHLRACLAALQIASGTFEVEARVMDQSDDDESQKVVEAFTRESFHYHRMPRNGACPARNLGAALSQAPLVAFLDDDCCPRPDWIERIVTTFESDRDLMFVFGQLKAPPEGDRVDGWYPEYLPSDSWQRERSLRAVAMVAAGANMIARRSFLFDIGGFDELLGPSVPTVKSNDSSISYKVLRSGAKWKADPAIEVVHVNGFRPYKDLARLFQEYDHGLGVNWARFARRGDMRAAWFFCLEHADMTVEIAKQLLRFERPRGLKNWAMHLKGFWDGFLLQGSVGYVSGAELKRIATTGELDPSKNER